MKKKNLKFSTQRNIYDAKKLSKELYDFANCAYSVQLLGKKAVLF